MTLPSSGPMSAAMINTELGRSATAPFSMNGAAERALAERPSGSIAMSDFYGKSDALLKTTITIGRNVSSFTTNLPLGEGDWATTTNSTEGFGFLGSNLSFGSVGNRNIANTLIRAILVTYRWSSGHSTYPRSPNYGMVQFTTPNNPSPLWGRVIIGNTTTTRTGNGVYRTIWATGFTGTSSIRSEGMSWNFFANTTNNRSLGRFDILGGRRSGTHQLIFEE